MIERPLASALAALAISCSATTTAPSGSGAGGAELNLPAAPMCSDAGAAPIATGACVSVRPRVFTTEVAPLFGSCSGEICHQFSSGAIAQQVDVPAHECCGRIAIITPFHPESSYLLNKLSGQGLCEGDRMPLGRAPFTAENLQIISDWICQGARGAP